MPSSVVTVPKNSHPGYAFNSSPQATAVSSPGDNAPGDEYENNAELLGKITTMRARSLWKYRDCSCGTPPLSGG